LLGRFHELSLPTADIRASIEFYESLGFSQVETGDTWSHPYGVVTDGRLVLGLHESERPACITYVRADVQALAAQLEASGIELLLRRTGPEVFNEIAFNDPAGERIAVLEARTHAPGTRRAEETSRCGYFAELSLPAMDFDAAQRFWEPLGFVAIEIDGAPYAHRSLTSDHLDLALHAPRLSSEPLLVFAEGDMTQRIAALAAAGFATAAPPAGLDARANARLRAPEGTQLLLRTWSSD
jgi:catechol 2,3-dioxygenase-like lactoylglutathione lyase family enzyme